MKKKKGKKSTRHGEGQIERCRKAHKYNDQPGVEQIQKRMKENKKQPRRPICKNSENLQRNTIKMAHVYRNIKK